MSEDVAVRYEFDQFPGKTGYCFIRRCDDKPDELVLKIGEKEQVLMYADRDQWGVYLTIGDMVVAQEDGTRSFLNGLIECLHVLSRDNEGDIKPATAQLMPLPKTQS